MKLYCYSKEQIETMVLLLNKIEIKGMEQAKLMSSLATIIDGAQTADIQENESAEEGEK